MQFKFLLLAENMDVPESCNKIHFLKLEILDNDTIMDLADMDEMIKKEITSCECEGDCPHDIAIHDGKIYGDFYECYTSEDVMKITDVHFLDNMWWAILPSGQPVDDDAMQRLTNLLSTIEKRIKDLTE